MHGHTWTVRAWWLGNPCAVTKQAELTQQFAGQQGAQLRVLSGLTQQINELQTQAIRGEAELRQVIAQMNLGQRRNAQQRAR
jgi:hypothetical protein